METQKSLLARYLCRFLVSKRVKIKKEVKCTKRVAFLIGSLIFFQSTLWAAELSVRLDNPPSEGFVQFVLKVTIPFLSRYRYYNLILQINSKGGSYGTQRVL